MSLSNAHSKVSVNNDINIIAEQVKGSRITDVLEDLSNLDCDGSGKRFHVSLKARDDYDTQHISGENGVPYPSFEIEIEYSANRGSKYDLDDGQPISRAPRASIFYAPKYERDDITGEVTGGHIQALMVSYDSAHRSKGLCATTSHEFDMSELANEEAVVASIYEFLYKVAPNRVSEVRSIINAQYDGNLNPENRDGISIYSPDQSLDL